MMITSKVTEKYQATIPKEVRDVLGIKKGDRIEFQVDGNVIHLRKLSDLDVEFSNALESTLSEWSSKEDDEAYDDL